MDLTSLIKRHCPLCDSTDDHHVFFKQNIDLSKFNDLSFASRKMPEFMNLNLVCCPTCDLLYAPRLPTTQMLEKAYHTANYDSDEEAIFAAKSYGFWLPSISKKLPSRNVALDIGTGNGAFLDELLKAGFKNVVGFEPSAEAAASAPSHLKPFIKIEMFDKKAFPSDHFDLITIFQTLEHIDNPLQFFKDAYQLLKPGGAIMMVTHNYRHWLMRLLGKKAPIIDIEHLQLFSPESLKFALRTTGFKDVEIHSLRNTYPLHYWFKLLPLPRSWKESCLRALKFGNTKKIGNIQIGLKAGNLIALGYKK